MHDAAALSYLPSAQQHPNSLVHALCVAAHRLGLVCEVGHILVHTGWGWGVVAAEEWWDPATTLWHPSTVTHIIAPLAQYVSTALQRLTPLGLECRDAWFPASEHAPLLQYIRHGVADHAVVLLWGCHGPGYCVVHAVNADGGIVCAHDHAQAIPSTRLHGRGGIHCVCVYRASHVSVPGVQWQHIVAPLVHTTRVDFATPQHPMRAYQTWHIGSGAWDVLAATAAQAAPLALVGTHVAHIIKEYAWRMVCMRDSVTAWQAHHTHVHATRLVEGLADCCFFVGILYKHYAHERSMRALSTADGALIAAACSDIASTLRDLRELVGAEASGWWAEQDSNL